MKFRSTLFLITIQVEIMFVQVLKDRRIDLLFRVTEGDGYPELTATQLNRGLSIAERNRLFRTFVRNTFNHHLQEIYLSVAKEYTDWENPSQNPLQVKQSLSIY